jgi:hypothetical protein
MPRWLQLALVLILALFAWISGLDSHGAPVDTVWLWAASGLLGAHLVYRFAAR